MLVYQRVSDFFPWQFLWMALAHPSETRNRQIWALYPLLFEKILIFPTSRDLRIKSTLFPFNPQLFPYVLPYFPMVFPMFCHIFPCLSHQNLHEIHENFPPGKPWRWPWTAVTATCEAVQTVLHVEPVLRNQRWRDLCIVTLSSWENHRKMVV